MPTFHARTTAGLFLVIVAAQGGKPAAELPPWKADPKIRAAIATIRPAELESTIRRLVEFGTRHAATDSAIDEHFQQSPPLEGAEPTNRLLPMGIEAARRYLVSEYKRIARETGERLQVREEWTDLVSKARLPEGRARGANVVATLPGTDDPKRVIVIGGHYDSINRHFDKSRGGAIDIVGDAPGADDDGSGTAVAVACARALAGMRFPATIEFVCFTAEETGLLGSKAHAEGLKAAGARVEAVLNNDIVGASVGPDGVKRDKYIRVFSPCPKGLDSPARNLARHASEVAAMYVAPFEVKLVLRKDRYGRSGDHISFDELGFPGIRFTEPRENYAHQHEDPREEKGVVYGDRLEFLDFEYLANVARVNAALAAELASAPPAPRVTRIGGALRQDTLVEWPAESRPRAEESIVGYEAVVRDTAAPRWERAHAVALGGKATIPEVLDDVVIGLRAVGSGGHRSFATVPPDPETRPASAPASR